MQVKAHGADCSPSLQVVGLATVSAACCTTSDGSKAKKWAFVVGAPTVLTALVYATIDQSKFEGYSSADQPPLSNWGGGSFGLLSFFELWASSYHQGVYVIRLVVSITLHICSILLVLIDSVCLEVRNFKGVLRVVCFTSESKG